MADQVRHTSFSRSALAGFVGAGSATVVFHPLDTLKVVLQRGGVGKPGVAGCAGAEAGLTLAPAFRELGVLGLWRGVIPAGISMSTACAVRMGAFACPAWCAPRARVTAMWARRGWLLSLRPAKAAAPCRELQRFSCPLRPTPVAESGPR
jgi:hypothetical protein